MPRPLCLLPCLALFAVGCAGGNDPSRTSASTRFGAGKALLAAIGNADKVALYEGLPHPEHEHELLEKEKQTKDTVTLHGFPFYAEALDLTAEDVTKLRTRLSDTDSFEAWKGSGKCGGFHPDYLVVWRVGEAVYRVLLCFGCEEVKVYGPGRDLQCHMRREAREELRSVLETYRKNRPPRQKG